MIGTVIAVGTTLGLLVLARRPRRRRRARSAGDEALSRLRRSGDNAMTWLGNTRVLIPGSAWADARKGGVDLLEAIGLVNPKAWAALRNAAAKLGLADVYLTSLYRSSGSGPHTEGRALDVGYLKRSGEPLVLLKRTAGDKRGEPELARRFREALVATAGVTQVLGPWWMYSKGSYDRPNDERTSLDVEHLTHVHLGVSA